MTATEGTRKARRLVAKLNSLQDAPGMWLVADAIKTLCQEIEHLTTELAEARATHVHKMDTAVTTGIARPIGTQHFQSEPIEPWHGKAGQGQ